MADLDQVPHAQTLQAPAAPGRAHHVAPGEGLHHGGLRPRSERRQDSVVEDLVLVCRSRIRRVVEEVFASVGVEVEVGRDGLVQAGVGAEEAVGVGC